MKTSSLAMAVCTCALATQTRAADWLVNSTLTERAEISDNEFLNPKPIGPTLGSFSTITGNAEARTPTSRFDLNGDFTYTKYLGPGSEATSETEATNEGVSARYENSHKLDTDKDYIEGSWRRQNLALALLNQIGFATPVKGNVDVFAVGGGIERSLSKVDLISVSAHATSTDYEPANAGVQYIDVSALGTWKHQVYSTFDLTASSNYERLTYDDVAKTNVTILRELGGARSQLSPRLTFIGSAGFAVVQSQQGVVGFPTATPTASGNNIGFIGNMILTYNLLKTTTVSFTASRSIAPSIVGSLLLNTDFGANVTHAINQSSSLSLSGDISQQTSLGVQTDFLSASIGYSKILARDWNAQATYRFLHRGASTGSTAALVFDPVTGIPISNGLGAAANSNTIILALSHNITVIPRGQ